MAALQSTRGVTLSHSDENMDTYYCEQQERFRQIQRRRVEPVNVPIVYLDLLDYRRPGKLCKGTGCKCKTFDEVAGEESSCCRSCTRGGGNEAEENLESEILQ